VHATDPVLEKPIRVVQPSNTDYLETGCIGSWAFAISDELEGPSVHVPEELKQSRSWLGAPLSALREYFGENDPPKGEGLVVVAHHTDGRLSYKKDETPFQSQEIARRFGAGSAGILAMCGAGAPTPVQSQLIDHLNKSGLDAAVLSPFALADFGRPRHRVRAGRRARTAGGLQATLAALFD
jgi:hypothetical protein